MSDKSTTGEWTADTVRRLEFDNSDRRDDAIAAAHNAALAVEQRKHDRELADYARKQSKQLAALQKVLEAERLHNESTIMGLEQQLAAERDELAAGQVIAQRLFRVVEQLPDVKHNSPNFLQTIKELQDACKAIPTTVIDDYVAEQLAAERENSRRCTGQDWRET